jgi:hypothetical protein
MNVASSDVPGLKLLRGEETGLKGGDRFNS